jgi:hypothetical protein
MKSLRSVHLTAGLAGVVLFLLSGQYMHLVLGHLTGMDAGPRMLTRSAHIYLLWSSLLNLLLGCYLSRIENGIFRVVQTIASAAILVGPILLCIAFFYEPYMQGFARPFARAAIYAAFAGAGSHALLVLFSSKGREKFNSPLDTDASRRST